MDIKKSRLIAGMFLSPLIPPVIYFFGVLFFTGYVNPGSGHIQKLILISLSLLIVSYLGSLILGTLIVLFLYRVNKLSRYYCVLSATSVSAMTGLVFALLNRWPIIDTFPIILGGIGGMSGYIISYVFCRIVGLRV